MTTLTPAEQALAEALLAARRSGSQIPVSETRPPESLESAYRIQAAIYAATGAAGGFKAGRPDGDAVPTYAPILAALERPDGGEVPAEACRLRGVELEVGLVLTAPPPAPTDPEFEAKLRRSLAVIPAIEIVESRLDDHIGADPLLKLADSSANYGLVRGPAVRDWSGLDLAERNARLKIGDKVVWDGPARVPGGDAFLTVAALARALGDHCGGLKEGHAIITGALTGLLYAEPGDAVVGEIEGVGSVSVAYG